MKMFVVIETTESLLIHHYFGEITIRRGDDDMHMHIYLYIYIFQNDFPEYVKFCDKRICPLTL